MSLLSINGSVFGNQLQALLEAPDIVPGDAPSYQICKAIYAYHPLGGKLVDFPVQLAQSQRRKVTVQKGPEERLVEAYWNEWKAIQADRHILNTARLARVYGISAVSLVELGRNPNTPIDFTRLATERIAFNTLDPLNTAGSLILNQDPNAPDFQKVRDVSIAGVPYHRSRVRVLMNEDPLYIEYTTSAFGYVGRSIYQRALYPLKSFLNTQRTNDMVATKAGALIAKMKQPTSVINQLMSNIQGQKRELLRQAQTGNVLSIGSDDDIESLNLQNIDGAGGWARKNIIEDIASSSGTPAKLILQEAFAEGFGEGTEDAKAIAQHISGIREWLQPLYEFFDEVVMWRAWNPEFYRLLQRDFPEQYKDRGFKEFFYESKNSFRADWPSLIEEPDSDKVEVDKVKLEAVCSVLELLMPRCDPENLATLIQWAADEFNASDLLFSSPLVIDAEALATYEPPVAEGAEGGEGGGFRPPSLTRGDSSNVHIARFRAAAEDVIERRREQRRLRIGK